MAKRKKNPKKRISAAYLLLSLISVLLLMIIAYIGGYSQGNIANSDEEDVSSVVSVPVDPYIQPESGGSLSLADPDYDPQEEESDSAYATENTVAVDRNPAETTDDENFVSGTTIAIDNASGNAIDDTGIDLSVGRKKKILYFVLDDVGNEMTLLRKFLKIPIDITYAVMPQRSFSQAAAQLIHQNNREVIMHQPMEPIGNSNPGKGAIFTWMRKNDIFKELQKNLTTVPYAVGINNHMGSKATTDKATMSAVFEYLKEQDMFFLDSKTSSGVVGGELTHLIGGEYVQRNAMFLDNDKDKDKIELAIRTGMKRAEQNGHAVMIGHVMTTELADALLDMYPEILDEGYEFDRLSEYFTGEDEE